jgi:hypothetical protein
MPMLDAFTVIEKLSTADFLTEHPGETQYAEPRPLAVDAPHSK